MIGHLKTGWNKSCSVWEASEYAESKKDDKVQKESQQERPTGETVLPDLLLSVEV